MRASAGSQIPHHRACPLRVSTKWPPLVPWRGCFRRHPWTRPLSWRVMATGTSRREGHEPTRSSGSAPWSQRTWTMCGESTVVAGRGWWLAIAVVVGLFAMHGLGMHGSHSGEGSSAMNSESISSAPGVTAPGMSATGHDGGVAGLAGPQTADVGTTYLGLANEGSTDPSSGAGLLGLCLALLAFGVLWLRRRTSGRPAWTVPRRTLEACVARLSVTARDLSPPLRAELSIWRC